MSARWQFVKITPDSVEMAFNLIFDEEGGLRLTRGEGKLDRGERSMGLTLKVPRSLWRTPQLKATIEIADAGIPRPVIDVAAANAAIREVKAF